MFENKDAIEVTKSKIQQPLTHNQNESKKDDFIRVFQGKICRMNAGTTNFNGLYTDDFSSCNIIVLHNKDNQKISMIHADSSTTLNDILNEVAWVGNECEIQVYLKEKGRETLQEIFLEFKKLFPKKTVNNVEDESACSVSATFKEGSWKIQPSSSKILTVIRHPMEAQFETIHKLHVGFFYVLKSFFNFNATIIAQWNNSVNKVIFDGENWIFDNSALHLCNEVKDKLKCYEKDSKTVIVTKMSPPLLKCSEDVVKQKRGISKQERKKALESDKLNIERICGSIAETIWCHHNKYSLHQEVTDSKAINEAYQKIIAKREQIKDKCTKLFRFLDRQSNDELLINFNNLKPFIRKFFCKEESILEELERVQTPFITFMENRIKNPPPPMQAVELASNVAPIALSAAPPENLANVPSESEGLVKLVTRESEPSPKKLANNENFIPVTPGYNSLISQTPTFTALTNDFLSSIAPDTEATPVATEVRTKYFPEGT